MVPGWGGGAGYTEGHTCRPVDVLVEGRQLVRPVKVCTLSSAACPFLLRCSENGAIEIRHIFDES